MRRHGEPKSRHCEVAIAAEATPKILIGGFLVALLLGMTAFCWADKVITKDGKTYSGKILIDGDKAVLIGNPPFDPNSTLIKSEDIEKIIYEEYKPNSPGERKRGLAFGTRLTGNAYSSSDLSLNAAGGIDLEAGMRFHPAIEVGGGVQWIPATAISGGDFTVVASTVPGAPRRGYHSFGEYSLGFSGKIYPFFQKKWKTEPYLLVGYGWNRLKAKGSGDSFKGDGWTLGAGALQPLSKNLFLEGQFRYRKLSYDTINFLGHEARITPEIDQSQFSLSLGLSYRI